MHEMLLYNMNNALCILVNGPVLYRLALLLLEGL